MNWNNGWLQSGVLRVGTWDKVLASTLGMLLNRRHWWCNWLMVQKMSLTCVPYADILNIHVTMWTLFWAKVDTVNLVTTSYVAKVGKVTCQHVSKLPLMKEDFIHTYDNHALQTFFSCGDTAVKVSLNFCWQFVHKSSMITTTKQWLNRCTAEKVVAKISLAYTVFLTHTGWLTLMVQMVSHTVNKNNSPLKQNSSS